MSTSTDPRIAAAIAASEEEVAAILAGKLDEFGAALAPDIVCNSPLEKVHRRDDVLNAFRRGFLRYHSFDRRIEYAGWLGEFVVLMGVEILAPKETAPHAGKIVHRRFTDLWRNDQGAWRCALRHATIARVE